MPMKTHACALLVFALIAIALTPVQAFLVENQIVAEHPSGLLGMDLAVDRVDRPYLLYHEGPLTHSQWFARQEGPQRTWTPYYLNTPGSDEIIIGEGTAVDDMFNEHILLDAWPQNNWYPDYPHTLRYGRRVGSNPWTWSPVASRETRDFTRLVLFRLSPAETQPWVFWVQGRQLKRARLTGASWQIDVLLEYGSTRLRVLDLKVDARGNTHTLFVSDNYPDRYLKYARRGPDPAQTMTLKVAPEAFEYAGRLALDSQDRLHILYHYVTGNWHGLAYLHCTDANANTWQDEETPISQCTDEWFALDRFDEPIVVSRRDTSGELFLHFRQNGVWHELYIEQENADRKAGFGLDRQDAAHVGYRILGYIKAARALPNQSPVLPAGCSLGPLIAGHPAGAPHVRTVQQLLASASDPDVESWGGLGVALLAGTEGGIWEYSLDRGSTWSSLQFLNNWVSLGLTNLAFPLPPGAQIRLRPWANFSGSVPEALRYCAWDQFRGTPCQALELPVAKRGGASGFSAEAQATSLTVLPYSNSAPTLAAEGAVQLDPVAMNAGDASNTGTLVADLLSRVTTTDSEGDPIGIAVTGVNTDHGSWQCRVGGGAWLSLVPVPTRAQLLQPTDRVRFSPSIGYVGVVPGFNFRAWDQTSAGTDTTRNGGSSAFSATQLTASVEVVPPNLAPVLAMPVPFVLPTVYRNQPETAPATRVSDLIAGHWTDSDGNSCGVAIMEVQGRDAGTWMVDLNGTGSWQAFPTWLPQFACLIGPAAEIRFVPSTGSDRDLDPALKFLAWDQTTGSAGTCVPVWSRGGYTPFSESAGTAQLRVRFVNTASPVMAPGQNYTNTIPEDIADASNTGFLVADLMANRATDVDGNNLGAAIGYCLDNHGTWQYRLASASVWQNVQWTGSLARRRMLDPDSRIRFRPDPNWNGTVPPPSLQVHAWDRTFGTNGDAIYPGAPSIPNEVVSPFSGGFIEVSVRVTPVPDPPGIVADAAFELVLDLGVLQPAVVRIGELIHDKITDVDGDTCGIAVYSANHLGGRWEFSETDLNTGQVSWTDLGDLVTPWVWLLGPDRNLRFVPEGPLEVPLLQGLFIRGWDQTTGQEGKTNQVGFAGGGSGLSKEWAWVAVRQRNIEFATVGDPGNARDEANSQGQSHGAVNYVYRAGKFEVSNREYCAFLNAVAGSDPYGLYPSYMVAGQPYELRGIERLGEDGSYSYRCFPGREELPSCYVGYYSALRYANWLHNGGGNGYTEAGAYTLLGGTPTPTNRVPIVRNPGARVWLLSEDEWYKAAFYRGGSADAGYWEYAVQSDNAPVAERPPGGSHSVNCASLTAPSPTPVGAYQQAMSAYGTFDQNGNLQEWFETPVPGGAAFLRGSTFDWDVAAGAASRPSAMYGVQSWLNIGFRIGARGLFQSNAAPVLQFEGAYVVSYDLAQKQWGHRVVELLGNLVSDLDGQVCGMAVVGVDRRYGEWQYGKMNQATGEVTWFNFGNPTLQAALLLGPECQVRFIPNPDTYPGGAVPGMTFRAWDRTTGTEFALADTTLNGGETTFSAAVRTILGRSNVAVVGDPGNVADELDTDQRRHGAVNSIFRVGKYEVSNREYCTFLNAVARSDPYGLYPSYMVAGQPYEMRGIERIGEPGSYSYRCFAGREDLPSCYVGYYSALRYVNWMHNGGGSGNTEDGTYTLLGGTPTPTNREPILRNAGASVWLLSEDEWYKAAYYKGGGADAGYWEYAVQSNALPLSEAPPGGPYSVNCVYPGSPTPVGAYALAASAYGTYDQTGNLAEWLETPGFAGAAYLRGGPFDWDPQPASRVAWAYGVQAYANIGFRIGAAEQAQPARPAVLPPPNPASGEPLVISWAAQAGWWFQLQEIADLGQAEKPENWSNYGQPIKGTGGPVSIEIPIVGSSGTEPVCRFYRIVILPP
jgi:hypothetical protein